MLVRHRKALEHPDRLRALDRHDLRKYAREYDGIAHRAVVVVLALIRRANGNAESIACLSASQKIDTILSPSHSSSTQHPFQPNFSALLSFPTSAPIFCTSHLYENFMRNFSKKG